MNKSVIIGRKGKFPSRKMGILTFRID